MIDNVGKSLVVEVVPRCGEFSGSTSPILSRMPPEVTAVEYSRGTLKIFICSEQAVIPTYLSDMFEGFDMRISKYEK
jgi:hypothetical protein